MSEKSTGIEDQPTSRVSRGVLVGAVALATVMLGAGLRFRSEIVEAVKSLRPAVSLEEFRRDGQPSTPNSKAMDTLSQKALRLKTSEGDCTATIINGYAVSAGHCVPEGYAGYVELIGQDEQIKTALSKWKKDDERDILIGKFYSLVDGTPQLTGVQLSDTLPPVGTRYVSATLADHAKVPRTGSFTYLRQMDVPAGGRQQFADDPDGPYSGGVTACLPGGSGALMATGAGHFSVTVSLTRPEEIAKARNNARAETGVNLDQVNGFCNASSLTQTFFDRQVAALNVPG